MAKRVLPPVEENNIRLRLLVENDLPLTLKWRNQDHIRKWFVHSEIISIKQHQQWFEKYQERDNDYVFIIEDKPNNYAPIGQISLYNIDWEQKSGEFGRLMIGEKEALGKGIAKNSTKMILNLAFSVFFLENLELEVFEDNSPAIAIYQSCSFKEVSTSNNLKKMVLKKTFFINNTGF